MLFNQHNYIMFILIQTNEGCVWKMEGTELFWNADLEALKRGYIEETHHLVCLLCGNKIEKGIIYPKDDLLFEAEKFMTIHIQDKHQSVFDYLIGLNKKLTRFDRASESTLTPFLPRKKRC